ncbi:hypothetical protein J3E64_001954 [Sphingobium sp. OAS761]|uniref:TonB-dependent receptor n=1 Tax=Sphingobium sp. OAS761 TaxID=2817901 RepID=UPI00209F0FB6|nr:TonB-dependent receptor [Sphingobium sp. OAS761]MCP1470266.1 hypothetical protein [Sphingobium sp. OAS761]
MRVKSDWLDGELRTNLPTFHTYYSNMQVTQYTESAGGGGAGFTRNANAMLKGFELETILAPVAGLVHPRSGPV